ncbi:MAG: Ig domain-containing protein [Saprospiraceae bacterium]|nr:Ig domain-containing protein [Saprospiraceae bacterium]
MITFSPKCGSCPASLPSGNLCLGATLQLSPASGGMWTSSNPSVASVTNAGLVTALSAGVAIFTFVNSTTACSSTTSNLTVNTNPSAAGASTVCVGETANITPGTNGTWTSSNSSIATITNAGVISGISAGSVTFTYTRTADGCTTTWPFTVLANPAAPLIGTITQPTCFQSYRKCGSHWFTIHRHMDDYKASRRNDIFRIRNFIYSNRPPSIPHILSELQIRIHVLQYLHQMWLLIHLHLHLH